ncbi:MAG: AAA family ATPase, partial [Phycisphaerales bacterium]|nr:AAA family ATPase [Phycisphaerales bacterium]
MRAVITGQIGMDKKQYLNAAARLAGQRGTRIDLFHVGDMMYAEGRDIRPGRILDLPLSRLTALRRGAFKDIIAATNPPEQFPNVVINTHATFRWRHGLFSAIDFDQIQKFEPNMLICLVDNIEVVHHRLHAEHEIDATLKDCMVWREEEILATELLAQATGCQNQFYILSRGRHAETIEACVRLITRPDIRKVYPSFPMSHVVDMPDVLAEIDTFRSELAKHFIAFDPGDVDEKLLLDRAIAASREGKEWLEVAPHSFGGRVETPAPALAASRTSGPVAASRSTPNPPPSPRNPLPPPEKRGSGRPMRVSVREVLEIAGDIDGQIYMRDFKLIDQSDMICSLIPELPGGVPALSSGVERELQHAWEHTKEVYVVWKPRKNPSPFITETATKIFRSVDEAMKHFENKGMFPERD